MTLKKSVDGTEALIARGHLDDIQRDSADHVHLWGLGSDFRLHDMRHDPKLAPLIRDEEREREHLGGGPRGRAALEERDRKQSALVSEAKALLYGEVSRDKLEKAKELQKQWRETGKPSPEHYAAFNGAIQQLFEMNRKRIEDLKRTWESNLRRKESVISRAQILAAGDLQGSGPKMKALMDEWKSIGQVEKKDADRLWNSFKAAQDRLRQRNSEAFEKRKAEWARNKTAKESLVSRMQSLVNGHDGRAMKDGARALQAEWKSIGQVEKSDADALWSRFKGASDNVYTRANQLAAERAWEKVRKLEEMLRNAEANFYRAQESYSRALSARSPSMRNPNYMSIVSDQQMRQATARSRLQQAEERRAQVVQWLVEARGRANR